MTPDPFVCYPTKAPSGIKRSPEGVMNDKSDDEIEEAIVKSCFL